MEYILFDMYGKLDTLLNMTRQLTDAERERSYELGTGYEKAINSWTLIIIYAGAGENIEKLAESFQKLVGGYGILLIKEENIDKLAQLDEVLFIEMPKKINI